MNVTSRTLRTYYAAGVALEVQKTRRGFLVFRPADGASEFLGFFEGLALRLFKSIPKRLVRMPEELS